MRRRMRARRQAPETIQWPNRRRIAPFVVIGSSILLLLVTFKMVPKADNNYPMAPDGVGGANLRAANFKHPQPPEDIVARQRIMDQGTFGGGAGESGGVVDEMDYDIARVKFDGAENYRNSKRENTDREMEEKGHLPRPKHKPELLIGLGSKSKRSPKRAGEKSLNKMPSSNDTKSKGDTVLLTKLSGSSPPPINDQRPKETSQSGEPEFMLTKELHQRRDPNFAILPKLSNGKKLNPALLPKPSFYRADIYRERKLRRARAMAALRRKAG